MACNTNNDSNKLGKEAKNQFVTKLYDILEVACSSRGSFSYYIRMETIRNSYPGVLTVWLF